MWKGNKQRGEVWVWVARSIPCTSVSATGWASFSYSRCRSGIVSEDGIQVTLAKFQGDAKVIPPPSEVHYCRYHILKIILICNNDCMEEQCCWTIVPVSLLILSKWSLVLLHYTEYDQLDCGLPGGQVSKVLDCRSSGPRLCSCWSLGAWFK